MSLECGQYLIAKECNVIQTMQDSVAAFSSNDQRSDRWRTQFSDQPGRQLARAQGRGESRYRLVGAGEDRRRRASAFGQVIRLANSVALNPSNMVVRDVRQAVVRVGMDPIKALAMVLIMDQLRHSQRHVATRELSNRLWERSVHVAALSYVLTKKLTRLNADEVMFAGIVHDLGRFYLLSRAAEFPALLEDSVAGRDDQ